MGGPNSFYGWLADRGANPILVSDESKHGVSKKYFVLQSSSRLGVESKRNPSMVAARLRERLQKTEDNYEGENHGMVSR